MNNSLWEWYRDAIRFKIVKDFNSDLAFAISIRTMFGKGDKYFAQAGGGIVQDSIPEKEFEETYMKMYSILKSIKIAEGIEK